MTRRARSTALTALLLGGVFLAGAGPSAGHWERLVKKYVSTCSYSDTDGAEAQTESLVLHYGKAGASPEEIARVLGARFRMSHDAATAFLHAFLTFEASVEREVSDEKEPSARQLQSMESMYREAFRLAPDSPEIVRSLCDFYQNYEGRMPGFPAQVLPLVESVPSPGDAAVRLANCMAFSEAAAFKVIEAALVRHPAHPWLLATMASAARSLDGEAALYETAMAEALRAGWTQRAPRLAGSLAEAWIDTLLDAGLGDRALEAYGSLPVEVREVLDSGATDEIEGRIDGIGYRTRLRDVRPGLAAAERLAGSSPQDRTASLWRAKVQEIDATVAAALGGSRPGPDAPALLRLGILRALDSPDEDPFATIVAVLKTGDDPMGGVSCCVEVPGFGALRSLTWQRTFLGLLRHERDLDNAQELLDSTLESLEEKDKDRTASPPTLPCGANARAESLRASMAVVIGQLRQEAAELRDAPARRRGAETMAEAIEALLARPRIQPFVERPLPPGIRPVKADPQATRKMLEDLSSRAEFPEGFDPVRFESSGTQLLVLAASQNFDPVGEISSGGYWLLRSLDGGKNWRPPLYTGLRIYVPYVIRSRSKLPLLEGDRLRIEVDIKEIDESSITFPPVMLRAKREKTGIYLDFDLAALEKDSDGDGLTDLAEERLLTDPERSDTDGDGIRDGEDLMPAVPSSGAGDGAEGSIAAAFNHILGTRMLGLIEPMRDATGAPGISWRHPAMGGERALFVVGDRSDFAGLESAQRMVILSESELEKVRAKFGLTLPLRMPRILRNRTGDRAYVVWSEGWRGGSFLLERQHGEWRIRELSGWIT